LRRLILIDQFDSSHLTTTLEDVSSLVCTISRALRSIVPKRCPSLVEKPLGNQIKEEPMKAVGINDLLRNAALWRAKA
jgi:hypothetical protein